MARPVLLAGVGAVALGASMFSLAIVRSEAGYAPAGASGQREFAFFLAGWTLIAVGLVSWLRDSASRFGALVTAAGLAWFVAEWNNPDNPSALAFTVGLCLYVAYPAFVAHAALGYPSGRLVSRWHGTAVVAGYAGAIGVSGIAPTLFFDPRATGCEGCPSNLLFVTDQPELVEGLERLGVVLGVAWAGALCLLMCVRAVRTPVVGSVVVPGALVLGLTALLFGLALERGFLAHGDLEHRLWPAQVAAAFALALGVAWTWVRAKRLRRTMAALVATLARSPASGELRDALAATLDDPDLVLGYRIDADVAPVDVHGRAVDLAGLAQTALVADGREVAVLGHRPGLLDDPALAEQVTMTARLVLENERLQAEAGMRIEELRRSRARVVEAADAARRNLERDLHDGAQQRLVSLSISLALLSSAHPEIAGLPRAQEELRAATTDLRELAHGIYPSVLVDAGITEALVALREESPIVLELGVLPKGRFPPEIEATAYAVVSELVDMSRERLSVVAERRDGALVIVAELDGDRLDLTSVEDRIAAAAGSIAVVEHSGEERRSLRVEIPCEP